MVDISVIIPIYNTPKEYLNDSIQSLLSQNYPKLEILLIDDNSNLKETVSTCKKYAKDNKIKYIRLNKNLGVSNARNIGIKSASNNYIMFLDADDWIENNTFRILSNLVEKNPKCQIYMFNSMTVIDGVQNNNKFLPFDDGILTKSNIEELRRQIIFKRSNEYIPNFNCIGVSWAKFYSKKFLIDNHVTFDTELRRAEDHIFILSLLKYDPEIYYLNNYMYNYRRNYSSAVNKHNKNVKVDFRNTLERLEKLIDLKNNPQYTNIFYSRIAEYFILNFYSDFFHIDNKLSYKEFKKEIKILKNMYPYRLLLKYDLSKLITADETRKTIFQTKYCLYPFIYYHFKKKH
ncbi:MAG: glycosyltransferase family 2 protein [Clostridia bacterium]|nr:glycosyltransferase family 2 protein [Clostridia bacterium]